MQNEKTNEALNAKEKYQSAVESAYDYVEHFDLLETITNVGNDEVFTPRKTVTMMLDSLPEEVWHNPDYKWLNPATKNGVFEREIAIRLNEGLKDIIPDEETRKKHILQKMIYAYGQTKFTSNVARRTLYYCSQANRQCDGIKDEGDGHYVNGYAIGNGTWFNDAEGNIKTPKAEHWFEGSKGKKKCKFCGIGEDSKYVDPLQREQYAYEFIHFDASNLRYKIKHDFFEGETTMKFDIIIGNPPYQLNDGGGTGDSAKPIYNMFVEKAIELSPKYLSMIIPARWYSGGKGLDDFRNKMLNDDRISEIHDFPETKDVFPMKNIRGGVCYFLWDRDHKDNCKVFNHKGNSVSVKERPLLENGAETFIRYNEAISILNKIQRFKESTLDERVSSRLPFGIPSNFEDYNAKPSSEYNVILFRSDRSKTSLKKCYIKEKDIVKNIEWKDRIKVLVSKASPGGDEYPHSIISMPRIAGKNSVCTETYLIVDFVENFEQANHLVNYMKTKLFRFLMSLIKNTQNISKGVFAFVPVQNYDEDWNDRKLYDKYGITEDEVKFIEKLIKDVSSEEGIMEDGDDDDE